MKYLMVALLALCLCGCDLFSCETDKCKSFKMRFQQEDNPIPTQS